MFEQFNISQAKRTKDESFYYSQQQLARRRRVIPFLPSLLFQPTTILTIAPSYWMLRTES
jgi:hypothetical protein